MITDDPGTPGSGHWEINVGYTKERRTFETQEEAPIIDLNYGYGERLQLKYEQPYLLTRSDGSLTSGAGPGDVGVKWRFVDEKGRRPAVSTYPQLRFNPSSRLVERGAAQEGREFFLPVEVSHSYGKAVLDFEIGMLFEESRADEWAFGIVGGFEAKEGLEWLAEVHGTGELPHGTADWVFNIGIKKVFSKKAALILSLGSGLQAPGGDRARSLLYVGFQLTR